MMGGMRIIEYIEFRSLAVPEEFGAGAVFVVGLSWPYKHAGHSRSCSRAAAASSGSEFRGRTERKRRGRGGREEKSFKSIGPTHAGSRIG